MGTGFIRSPWPILILLVLIVLLFGANKLPGLARNMGESMRIFKSEVSEMRKDDEDDDHTEASIDVKREDSRRGERSYDAREERERDYRREDRERDYRRDDRDDYRREEPVREARDREDFLGDGRSDDLYRRD
ncbi:Sec-independent protein translocase subunit TatA [Dermabacter sp. p3-SID358]|uniref:Sec-independent protein translocase subunit TatA n=1 Tax=Dermabacter sp. p3-SID358 TaxID=2916114 RepID=UPI0021A49E3E|nr:Sec-independent protein translocase subunit TatA [Dermabacter sp. p3-SID358]MCT1866061.1 Sec-independent protein translocase subunit TatA [Dermabacter sp. p3-SID358]